MTSSPRATVQKPQASILGIPADKNVDILIGLATFEETHFEKY